SARVASKRNIQTRTSASDGPKAYKNTKPLIGILTQPCHDCPGKSYIAAANVKWVESAGGRVVPVRFYASDAELHRLFKSLNGLVFPGGLTWLWLDSPYVIAARKLFNWAVEANDAGHVFPVRRTQWHPEKPPYEFGMDEVPHSLDAIRVSHHLANVFLDQARMSPHKPESKEEELAMQIYSTPPIFSARFEVMDEENYDGPDITYYFDEPETPPSGPDDDEGEDSGPTPAEKDALRSVLRKQAEVRAEEKHEDGEEEEEEEVDEEERKEREAQRKHRSFWSTQGGFF
ncbi:Gamma-glutamyl hydrolase, partial [Tetrabaena socialis]